MTFGVELREELVSPENADCFLWVFYVWKQKQSVWTYFQAGCVFFETFQISMNLYEGLDPDGPTGKVETRLLETFAL